MSNTSSRILQESEHSVVTPMAWRATSTPPPAPVPARARPVDTEAPEDQDETKAAYQRGFSEGRTAGQEQTAAELQPLMDRMTRSLADLATTRSRVRKAAESDLLKLAIAIARRVLHRELTLDPSSIEGLIRVAF